jgi:omega-amidase
MKWKIACIQMDIAFGQPDINFQVAEQWMEKAARSEPDIVILPELWTTGYDLTRLNEIADQEAEKTIEFLKTQAQKHQIHIIDKHGKLIKEYDKLHLFQLMDEHHFLQPGEKDGLFTLDEKICAGFVCYDIRFPEWQRAHTVQGAEVLFVTAEWPKPRLDHWRALLISRAIENQAYVVAVNRTGSDVNNIFAGHSLIIDPWGNIISEAGEGNELLTGNLDFNKVTEARNKIPVFEDRRPDFY